MSFRRWLNVLIALWLLVVASPVGTLAAGQGAPSAGLSPNVTVFASGLNNPRGLHFGPDGRLYVAEAGTGGALKTSGGQCPQVLPPVGPYSGSLTGSDVLAFDSQGHRTVVASGFPSSETAMTAGGFVSGIADLAWIGRTMYVVTAGSGCSHGLLNTHNLIARINKDGSHTEVANLSAFLMANPVVHPNPPDFEPDGTFYSLLAYRGALYTVEPNHGELDRITTSGKVSRIADISASQGHIVPTAITARDGAFIVGNLDDFPAKPDAKIMRIARNGQIQTIATGLTTVLGVLFDEEGRLYALQTSAPAPQPGPPIVPGTGSVVRLGKDGTWKTIASGLTFPTAMTFGPDGDLYVSDFGFTFPNFPPASGRIVRIHLGETG